MAQLVEQRIRNAWVAGSSPAIGSLTFRSQNQHEDASSDSFFRNSRAVGNPINRSQAELAQLVEHWLPKPRVAGSSPVFRSKSPQKYNKYAP